MLDTTRSENIQRLSDILEDIRVLMLTTLHTENGSLHSRPMMVQKAPFDGTLWFFSKLSSAQVEEIRSGSQVNLAYADSSEGHYGSISGTAYAVPDRVKMEALWSSFYLSWFPKGLEEPDLVLIRVDVTQAEIWDSNSGEQGTLLQF